ncbi:hypothetical protein VNO77_42323 [Canavalia gladiata]|uniref:Uncharacterized protein n=1 Tax=Canavalia gladiata TaxID=3824 RepID=A0AAN9K0G0_CANGL
MEANTAFLEKLAIPNSTFTTLGHSTFCRFSVHRSSKITCVLKPKLRRRRWYQIERSTSTVPLQRSVIYASEPHRAFTATLNIYFHKRP